MKTICEKPTETHAKQKKTLKSNNSERLHTETDKGKRQLKHGNGNQRYQEDADETQEQHPRETSMKTQSQPQSLNAPSVRYHRAHHMKHPQIRLRPHCPTTNNANQRKNAKKKTNKNKRK